MDNFLQKIVLFLTIALLAAGNVCAQTALEGIYTIDNTQATGGRNFRSFQEAVNELNYNYKGISDAVTFNVIAGQVHEILTYSSSGFNRGLYINTGGTIDKPVIFRKLGEGPNPLLKIIVHDISSPSQYSPSIYDNTCISLNASYITLDGLDIEKNDVMPNSDNPDPSYPRSPVIYERGFSLMNGTNNKIINCNINIQITVPQEMYPLLSPLPELNLYGIMVSDGEKNIFQKCSIQLQSIRYSGIGHTYGIDAYWVNNTLFDEITVSGSHGGNRYISLSGGTGNIISKSIFDNFHISYYNQDDFTIKESTVWAISGSGGNNQSIYNNFISGGISLTSGNNQRIYNNIISNAISLSKPNVGDAIEDTIHIAHNTIYTSSSNCLKADFEGKLGLYNNIFINKSTYAGSRCININTSDNNLILPESNNNIYYCEGGAIYSNPSVTKYTVDEYIEWLGDGRESNSHQEDVPFISTVSPNNFNIRNNVLTKAESGGKSLSWVLSDIEGSPRFGTAGYTGTGTAPDIGAYEFEGMKDNVDLPPLHGTYVIDNTQPTADRNFNSFEEAITTLNNQGISDAVTFEVISGQVHPIIINPSYTDGLWITSGGMSDKPVIFRKSGSGDNPLLKVTGTISNFDACFYLDGVHYITFDGLDIENAGTSDNNYIEQGFRLNNTSNIRLLNCNIRLRSTSYFDYNYGVYTTGTLNELQAENLTIKNVSNGYYFSGSGTGNTISKSIIDSVGTGIYCTGTLNNFTIAKTTITNASTGIYCFGTLHGNNRRIYNNIIHATSNGIDLSGSSVTDTLYFAHNTVYIPAKTNTSNSCVRLFSSSGKLGLYNNIFVNKSTSIYSSDCIYNNNDANNSSILPNSNNNIYYCERGAIFRDYSISKYTVDEYIEWLGDGRENNSHQEDVPFISTVSPFDFNIRTDVPTAAKSGGQPLDWVLTDIEGKIRNPLTPDIGAYEFEGQNLEEIDENDYLQLKSVFNEFGGKQWKNKWNTNSMQISNNWPGVTFENGRVTGISLPDNNVTGELPGAFAGFPFLTGLDLSHNRLTGMTEALPETIEQLNLQYQTLEKDSIVLSSCVQLNIPSIARYDHAQRNFDFYPSYGLYESNQRIFGYQYDKDNYYKWDIPETQERNFVWRYDSGTELKLIQETGLTQGSASAFKVFFDRGDANIDQSVDVLDVQHTLNYIFDEHVSAFNFAAADTYKDNKMTVQDLVRTIQIILDAGETSSLRSDIETNNTLSIEDGQLLLFAEEAVAAMDIRLEGIWEKDISPLLDDTKFQFVFKDSETGTRLIIVSFTRDAIFPGRTVIAGIHSRNAEPVQVMASGLEAQAVPIRISYAPTGISVPKSGDFRVFAENGTVYCDLPRKADKMIVTLYNLQGMAAGKQQLINVPAGRQPVFFNVGSSFNNYILNLVVESEGQTVSKSIKLLLKK